MSSSGRKFPTLLPKPLGSDEPPLVSSSAARRKRTAITAACIACKQRKVKCDGQRPACSRCTRSRIACQWYTPEGLTSRQADKQRLLDAEKSSSSLHDIVELFRVGNTDESLAALERLKDAESINEAADTISAARALITAHSMSAVATPNTHSYDSKVTRPTKRPITSPHHHPSYIFEKQYAYTRDLYVDSEMFVDLPLLQLDISRWTSVSNDNKRMNHLLRLFWAWDNVVERVIYRPVFEEDLIGGDPDHVSPCHNLCSPFLVNALLALSCLFSSENTMFAEQGNSTSRGRLFAEEAERHLEKEKLQPSIPLLQGLLAMFIHESNLGSGDKAVVYFRQTIDEFRRLNSVTSMSVDAEGKDPSRVQREEESFSWVMWAFYSSLLRGLQILGWREVIPKPNVGKLWQRADFALRDKECSGFWWYPYPLSVQLQDGMKTDIKEFDVRLYEIVDDVHTFIIPGPDEEGHSPIEYPQRAAQIYDALMQWKLSLPPGLRLEDAVLPSAILLHCYAETTFAVLLLPFSQFTKAQFGSFAPKERIRSHVTALCSAIWSFRAFYTVRYEYWFTYALSTIAFVTLSDPDPGPMQMDNLLKVCQCLQEMTTNLLLAVDCLSAIHGAYKRSGLQLPSYLVRFFDSSIRHRKDGLMHHGIAVIISEEDEAAQLHYQDLLNELDGVTIH